NADHDETNRRGLISVAVSPRYSRRYRRTFVMALLHALRIEPHELNPIIRLRISRRRAGDEHHAFGADSVLAQPTRGPLAPVVGFLSEIDGMDAIGKCEFLTHSGIGAGSNYPNRRFARSAWAAGSQPSIRAFASR